MDSDVPVVTNSDDEVPLPIVTGDMVEEEKRLAEERAKQESAEMEEALANQAAMKLEVTAFSKLDDLLSKTQIYSQFLLEKMDDIAMVPGQEDASEEKTIKDKKPGKGNKRKPAVQKAVASRGRKKAKEAMESMLAAQVKETEAEKESVLEGSEFLTEEERNYKEQMDIVPLVTGGRLKGYQLRGIKWLISLWQNGLNGILADQMGLGKTVQTIGLLAHLKGKGMYGPFLVVAPLSTLSNWVSEVKRWVPSMEVLLYHAPTKDDRAALRSKHMPYGPPKESTPVIVTSYEVAMNDRRFLARHKWKYIIVDEGHRLKNFDCRLLRELKQIPADNVLLLTGTPLQNNLRELWSLLNFILPQIFSSLREFQSWFDLSERQTSSSSKEEMDESRRLQVVSKLHLILRPFLLRRLKKDVEKTLPLKKEIILYTPMTPKQREFHDHLINKTLNEYFEDRSNYPAAQLKSKINNVVMQLRKNCNHPDLFTSQFGDSLDYPPVDELVAQCGKLKLLDRLLKHLKDRGHKVLVFSQMTKVLDILEYYLGERGHNPCRIDGSVSQVDRQRQGSGFDHISSVEWRGCEKWVQCLSSLRFELTQIKEFNEEKSRFLFLLSTRAGGLGINLTSADTVIIYDSDWNPHMDMQAMDRCHRIGQTRPVHVYRLATAQSVECRMLKVATGKLKLEHLVIEKGQFKQEQDAMKTALKESDLLALLKQEQDEEEEFVQSAEISDSNLQIALDRWDLLLDYEEGINPDLQVLPMKGPGWEVVTQGGSGGNLLSSIEGYRKVLPIDPTL